MYSSFAPKVDVIANPLPPAKKKRRKNDPDFELRKQLYQTCGVDLTRVDGLDSILVQEIISEIGVDMSKWKTSKHFVSWREKAALRQAQDADWKTASTPTTSSLCRRNLLPGQPAQFPLVLLGRVDIAQHRIGLDCNVENLVGMCADHVAESSVWVQT